MSLSQLETLLFWTAIIIYGITLLIVVMYYWNTRYKGSNYLRNDEIPLRYFIQKQVDGSGKTIGYECLLRTQNEQGKWVLPKDLESLPLQRVIFLLEKTFESLSNEHLTVSINLTYNQIMSRDFRYFVRWAITKVAPMRFAVEFSADELNRNFNKRRLRHQIQMGRSYGMRFAINNVGSSLNDLKRTEWLLPETDILKASMSSFRKESPDEWLDLNLQFWNKLAKENQIELILVGIENDEDEQLAEKLQIDSRQGYLFGRPENIQERTVKNER
ncbi:EAL domain-containing protein [Pediococcus stilesii]|uniref:C-di-GMP-specific phosphodiesterase n=1 Tax=Pediococcus stilesii TaxID=331679 RepID=A0A0R2KXG0_9LACO|nr:EAL domain-containing protein [Pediococcus stilesii]KRN94216.1 C-di-GMP-specific phosphodiesterase [Pediococcus stilesii]